MVVPAPIKLLFVCSRARQRSATAEEIFAGVPGFAVMAAGTASDADVPVDADAIDWADVIFAMEPVHRDRLQRQFGSRLRDKRLIVLGIADHFGFMDRRLAALLRRRVGTHFPELDVDR